MSISLEASPQAPTAAGRALYVLQGKDNPFEVLARPQQADENFVEVHVAAFQEQERAQLLEMIDGYRLPEYRDRESLSPSRVVTVRGDRGSGKTHLLQSLVARPDGRPQVVVRPAGFNAKVPFEEYLLFQLKAALGQQDEFHADRPLDVIAAGLTRRLLRQALLGAGPTDRLFALYPHGLGRFRFLWGGGERALRRLDRLVGQLGDPALSRDLPALAAGHGLAPASAFRLVAAHLRAFETGTDLAAVLRRLLYQALARAALLRDVQGLSDFLAEGYREADPSGAAERSELVAAVLQALVEACALVRMPVVFAFDNLERLLSPEGRADADAARAFVTGIAQAVDTERGLLFLVFAESTLFEKQLTPALSDTFVRSRWEQGVPLAGRGPIFLIDLKPPTADDTRHIVRDRVGRLLADLPELKALPDDFPFAPEVIARLVGAGSVNLRNVLYGLRDEYSRIVYRKAGPEAPGGPAPDGAKGASDSGPTSALDWAGLLESAWTRGLGAVRRRFESATQHDLHEGLGRLLQAAMPLTLDGWSLNKVEASLPAGENPDYGVVSLLGWKAVEGGQPAGRGLQAPRVAVGFLLASGPGMARDLRAKFDFLRDRERGVRLVILWPTQRDGENVADLLPRGTRKAWDEEEDDHWRAELRRVEELDLRRILVFVNLLADVEEAAQRPAPADVVRAFVHQRVGRLFALLLPPQRGPQKG